MTDYRLADGRDLTEYRAEGEGKAFCLFVDAVKEKHPYADIAGGKEGVIRLVADESIENKDEYRIAEYDREIVISAHGTRGLIFGWCMLLRKCADRNGRLILIRSVEGVYAPVKKIRGHQLGYRPTPNAYDAWDTDDYRRYYTDIMAFGSNTVEHIPGGEKQNRLMKYTSGEMAVLCAAIADEYDLDVSLWFPNYEDTDEEAYENRKKIFSGFGRIDYVFPPGGDPGDLQADAYFRRLKAVKSALPEKFAKTQLWPSAQAPHKYPDWGEKFIAELEKHPEEIDGVIMGPNHAYPVHELRRKVPAEYPIRLYTDITHNVRCEYPVHFDRDDWHYALASAHGRESINPRPAELQLLHRLSAQYGTGTVTYSEGINDDVNKAVWADMDFFGSDTDIKETLRDYSRFFFPGADEEKVADVILGMELNWYGDPKNNPNIENTYRTLTDMDFGEDNWRWNCLLFRAICDVLVYRRRNFELDLVENARHFAMKGDTERAKTILSADFDGGYRELRAELDRLGGLLFRQIGYQCDVERYGAENPERGAVLDTVDQPVTDRLWLLGIAEKNDPELLKRAFGRNKVRPDEYYFSVAEHGTAVTGYPSQEGEPYLNFQGDDRDYNNGGVPVCLLNIFDNFSFRCRLGGFIPGKDYRLVVTWLDKTTETEHHRITANGFTVYEGPQFGGEEYRGLDGLVPSAAAVRAYRIPAEYFVNGTLELEFSEPEMGVMFAEFRIIGYEE